MNIMGSKILVAMGIASLAACAHAVDHNTANTAENPSSQKMVEMNRQSKAVNENSVTILSKIHADNLEEVAMGNLAKSRGSTDDIKRYGDRLMRDHRNAEEQVQRFATNHGITLQAPSPDAAKRAEMARVEKLSGSDFDMAFLKMMEKGHHETVSMLSQAERQITNGDLKDFISKLLPVLDQHYTLAERLDHQAHSAKR